MSQRNVVGRYLLGIVFSCMFLGTASAQFVAFSGKDSNPDDDFTFVALTEITIGTEIYFTNVDWDNTIGQFDTAGTNEGTLLFTATGTITRGTVVLVVETSPNSFNVPNGEGTATFVAGFDWSPTSADPHYAFTASNPASPLTTVTEVYAGLVTLASLPPALDPTTGTNSSVDAIFNFVSAQATGVDYNADRSMASPATLANEANFLQGASLVLDLTAFSGAALPVDLRSFSIE